MIIGLAGPGGVGKTTIAEELANLRGGIVLPVSGPLKDMMRSLYAGFGLSPQEAERRIDGDLKRAHCEHLGCTPTHAMQTLGTEWGRNMLSPDLWVRAWLGPVRAAQERGLDVINDTVRFDNEARAIRALGGVVVRLVGRDGDLSSDHSSEAGVSACFEVANVGAPRDVAGAILDRVRFG